MGLSPLDPLTLERERELRRKTILRRKKISQLSCERRKTEEDRRQHILEQRRNQMRSNASAIRSTKPPLKFTPQCPASTRSATNKTPILSLSSRGSRRYCSAPPASNIHTTKFERLITAEYRQHSHPDDDIIQPVNQSISNVPLASLASLPSNPYSMLPSLSSHMDRNLSMEERRLLASIAQLDEKLKKQKVQSDRPPVKTLKEPVSTDSKEPREGVSVRNERRTSFTKNCNESKPRRPLKSAVSDVSRQRDRTSRKVVNPIPGVKIMAPSKLDTLLKRPTVKNFSNVLNNHVFNDHTPSHTPSDTKPEVIPKVQNCQNFNEKQVTDRIERFKVPFRIVSKAQSRAHNRPQDDLFDDAPIIIDSDSPDDSLEDHLFNQTPANETILPTPTKKSQLKQTKTRSKPQSKLKTSVEPVKDEKDIELVRNLPETSPVVNSMEQSVLFNAGDIESVIELSKDLKEFLNGFCTVKTSSSNEFYNALIDGKVIGKILAVKLPKHLIDVRWFSYNIPNNWKILQNVLSQFDFTLDDSEIFQIVHKVDDYKFLLYELVSNLYELF
ncbi:hypothetical protein GEMRC1_007808 [Eukaryota sp. GEM-RC1]